MLGSRRDLIVALIAIASFAYGICSVSAITKERQQDFYKNTTFTLSLSNIDLLGGKYIINRRAHLPYWFDFEVFKKKFQKSYPSQEEELMRHHAYIRTCLRVIKARVMFRILAATHDEFITINADRLPDERITHNLADENTTPTVSNLISVSIPFVPDQEDDETPIKRAVRLMRAELDRVESKNQLVNYLSAFESMVSPFKES